MDMTKCYLYLNNFFFFTIVMMTMIYNNILNQCISLSAYSIELLKNLRIYSVDEMEMKNPVPIPLIIFNSISNSTMILHLLKMC